MKGIWPRVQFCTHRQILSKIHPSIVYALLSLVKRELLPFTRVYILDSRREYFWQFFWSLMEALHYTVILK